MTPPPDRTRLPDWLAERAHLGEAPGHAIDEARAAELAASDRAILEALPPAMVAAEIERRVQRHRRAQQARARLRVVGLGAFATAAAAVVVFASGGGGERSARHADDGAVAIAESPAAGGDRVKGDPRLAVHRLRGESIEELPRGARVAPGDLLQLSYVAAGRRFGAIVSIDGRGAVTLHLPVAGDTAAALTRGSAAPLDRSYQLDDAPGFERFILITAARPFALAPALAAAGRLAARRDARTGPLDLDGALGQHDFLLRKD